MSRKERTKKATFKSIICLVASFVLLFNMISVNTITAHAEGDEPDPGYTEPAVTEPAPAEPAQSEPAPVAPESVEVTVNNNNNLTAASTDVTVVYPEPAAEVPATDASATATGENGTTDSETNPETNPAALEAPAASSEAGTGSSEAAAQDPQPAVDEYKVAKADFTYSNNKKIVSVLVYHDSDNSITELKDTDFDINNLDTTKYNTSYDDETGILTIYEKPAEVQKGGVTISGNSNTVIYHDFVQITEQVTAKNTNGQDKYPVGSYIYFVPYTNSTVMTYGEAILGLPEGTAILKRGNGTARGDASSEIGKIIGNSNFTIGTNVEKYQIGRNFDGCPAGTLYYFDSSNINNSQYNYLDGYTYYWCSGGGVDLADDTYGRAYTFAESNVTISNDNLKVTSKENSNMKTGSFKIDDSTLADYVDLELTFKDSNNAERKITVAGCKVSEKNNTVNYRAKDTSIDLLIGNATVTLHLDTTGLEKKVWLEDNGEIIAQQIVTENDITKIQKALSQGAANIEIDGTENEYVELKDKLAAAIWQENNKDAIHASEDDFDMYYTVEDTKQRYDEVVSDVTKSHMDIDLDTIYNNMKTKINKLADDFVRNNITGVVTEELVDNETEEVTTTTSLRVFADATADNTDDILNAETSYNELHDIVKEFINDKVEKANKVEENDSDEDNIATVALSYGTLLERAKAIKSNADNFIKTFASALVDVVNNNDDEAAEEDTPQAQPQRVTYKSTDMTNYRQILDGAVAWSNLTSEEQKYANKVLALAVLDEDEELIGELSFDKLLADAVAIRNRLTPVINNNGGNYEAPTTKKAEDDVYVMPVAAKKPVVAEEIPAPVAKAVADNANKVLKKGTGFEDNLKARKENAHAIDSIYGTETDTVAEVNEKMATKKESILKTFENNATAVDAKVSGSAKQTFGLGAILINVETYLEDKANGTGMYLQSRGKDKSELQEHENQLSYTLENADTLATSVLTLTELGYVNNGDTMEIRLRVTPNEQEVSEEANQQFDEAIAREQETIPALTKGQYIDISLEKRHNSDDWQYVPNTKDMIRVALDVPEEFLLSGRQYYIMRNHDGECTLLNDLDDNEDTITIETDRFSDYLIMFDDTYAATTVDAAAGVLQNETVAAITNVTPFYNMNGTMAVVAILFLLLIFAVVAETARREGRR